MSQTGWRSGSRSKEAGCGQSPSGPGETTDTGYIASGALDLVLSVLATLSLALLLVVALFNRPRFLVAPGMRELPGLVDEWKGAPMPRSE
jgi:hypothetical protein